MMNRTHEWISTLAIFVATDVLVTAIRSPASIARRSRTTVIGFGIRPSATKRSATACWLAITSSLTGRIHINRA